MKRSDWLPGKREDLLEMANTWFEIIRVKGKLIFKMTQETIDEFEDALTLAKDEMYRPQTSRNAGTNVLLKEAFDKLAAIMRDFKRRYFLVPPLTHADIANLGLRMRDEIPTPVSVPQGIAAAEVSYPGGEQVLLRIKHIDGSPSDERADYGYKVYYRVYSPGETPPQSAKDLKDNVFTRNKKHVFRFEPEDKAKTAYFCIRYENSKGEAGPWGPMFSAVIP